MTAVAGLAAAVLLGGCDPATNGRIFDPLIKRMAGEQTLALFDELDRALREDDVEALDVMLMAGFEPDFATQIADYVPNEEPNARYYLQFNASTHWSTAGRSRTLQVQRLYRYEAGDYVLAARFHAADDAPMKIVELGFHPLFDDGSPPQPDRGPDYDPI